MPDSQEIADEVAYSVRVMEITGYGKEQLPAGPAIDDSDEIIVVEGRADVLNLLKYGFKNAIALNGTSVPQTIIELSRQKTVTLFVDGDRGGDLITRELGEVGEVDFVTKAPDGKEVEEITKKEINKALRAKIAFEQAKLDIKDSNGRRPASRAQPSRPIQRPVRTATRDVRKVDRPVSRPVRRSPQMSDKEKEAFKKMSDELVGTRGAFILDESLKMLGKVPVAELASTVKSLRNGIHAVIMDGEIDKDVAEAADASRVKFIVGTDCKLSPKDVRTIVVKTSEL
jgi:5S rRNA maturation endonuclease (ribonuclease M5)